MNMGIKEEIMEMIIMNCEMEMMMMIDYVTIHINIYVVMISNYFLI